MGHPLRSLGAVIYLAQRLTCRARLVPEVRFIGSAGANVNKGTGPNFRAHSKQAAHVQAKEVPGWLRRDTDLTGVEYIDTHSIKFHDRPLPNLSSQEKHRAGIWDDLGAETQRLSEEAYTLPIEARLGSGLPEGD
ncbi:hypothetical protein LA080_009776 [Diaporthe eres]|nr:hypothetical protein LA080_009776 [Diaporthe eres]